RCARKSIELPQDFSQRIGVGWCDRHAIDGHSAIIGLLISNRRSNVGLEDTDVGFKHARVVELVIVVGWLRPKSTVAQANRVVENESGLFEVVGRCAKRRGTFS